MVLTIIFEVPVALSKQFWSTWPPDSKWGGPISSEPPDFEWRCPEKIGPPDFERRRPEEAGPAILS